MKKNAIVCFGIYLTSVFFSAHLSENGYVMLLLGLLIVYLLIGLRFSFERKQIVVSFIILVLLGLRAGYIANPAYHFPAKYLNESSDISARVVGVEDDNDSYGKYIVKIEKISSVGLGSDGSGTKALLIAYKGEDGGSKSFSYGDTILLKCEPELCEGADNSGEIDYSPYYKSKGVYVRLGADAKDIKVLGHDVNLFNVWDLAHICRGKIESALDRCFSGDNLGLIKGIILSNRKDASKEFREAINIAGISHVCVASGMHAGYVFSFIMWLCVVLRIKKKAAYPICSAALFFFAMVEANASSMRAAVMISISLLAFLVSGDETKEWSTFTGAFLMLALNPYYIFDVGFMLSFASVTGIQMFYPLAKEKLPPCLAANKIFDIIVISLCAQVFTIPLLGYYFGYISAYAVLTNVLVTWIVPVIMLAGMICVVLYCIVPVAGIAAAKVTCAALIYVRAIVLAVSGFPGAKIVLHRPGKVQTVILLLIPLCIYFAFKRKRKLLKPAMIGLSVLLIFNVFADGISDCFSKVYFINVGEADASVIKTAGGQNIMIDGGGSAAYSKANLGETTVMPYLNYRNIKKLDVLVVTHFDKDHVQGALYLCENMRVAKVVLPKRSESYKNEYKEKIEKTAKEKGIKIVYVSAGDSLVLKDGTKIEVMLPCSNLGEFEENRYSMLAKITVGGVKLLYTGDIDKVAEMAAIKNGNDLKCDILKSAHHGSNTSNSLPFIEKADPTYAVISCGRSDSHPAESTIKTLNKTGAKIYRTNLSGDITFWLAPKKVALTTTLR